MQTIHHAACHLLSFPNMIMRKVKALAFITPLLLGTSCVIGAVFLDTNAARVSPARTFHMPASPATLSIFHLSSRSPVRFRLARLPSLDHFRISTPVARTAPAGSTTSRTWHILPYHLVSVSCSLANITPVLPSTSRTRVSHFHRHAAIGMLPALLRNASKVNKEVLIALRPTFLPRSVRFYLRFFPLLHIFPDHLFQLFFFFCLLKHFLHKLVFRIPRKQMARRQQQRA